MTEEAKKTWIDLAKDSLTVVGKSTEGYGLGAKLALVAIGFIAALVGRRLDSLLFEDHSTTHLQPPSIVGQLERTRDLSEILNRYNEIMGSSISWVTVLYNGNHSLNSSISFFSFRVYAQSAIRSLNQRPFPNEGFVLTERYFPTECKSFTLDEVYHRFDAVLIENRIKTVYTCPIVGPGGFVELILNFGFVGEVPAYVPSVAELAIKEIRERVF